MPNTSCPFTAGTLYLLKGCTILGLRLTQSLLLEFDTSNSSTRQKPLSYIWHAVYLGMPLLATLRRNYRQLRLTDLMKIHTSMMSLQANLQWLLHAPLLQLEHLHLLLKDKENLRGWLEATSLHHRRLLLKLVDRLLQLDAGNLTCLNVNTPTALKAVNWTIAHQIARSTTASTATLPPLATSQSIAPGILIRDLLKGKCPQDAWDPEPPPVPSLLLPTPLYSPLYNPALLPAQPTPLPSEMTNSDWDPNDLIPLPTPQQQPSLLMGQPTGLLLLEEHHRQEATRHTSTLDTLPPTSPQVLINAHQHILHLLKDIPKDKLDLLEYGLMTMTAQGLR
jgi:hypothetical protein